MIVWRRAAALAACGLLAAAVSAESAGRTRASSPASEAEGLDRIERAAFAYLWEEQDPRTGLVYNTTEAHAPASPTACGVMLSAIPVGIERGWIRREEGYRRAKQLLQTLSGSEKVHGFYYHFLDPRTGRRTWNSELSCIDSSILFAGALVAAQYFAGTEVARLAQQLVLGAEWPWFLDGEDTLRWGWRPESGFEGGPMEFSESVLAYLLAFGSPTHPIPSDSWDAMRRPITATSGGHRLVYTPDGSLFAYLLPLVWFDLRNRHDAYLDYWTNAKAAILANIQFCRDHRTQFRTYREGLWGLSAALGPDGYKAYGAPPAVKFTHDGTVAPYVVAAAMPFFPDIALDTYRLMERLAPALWTRYGLGDALNLDRNYACPQTIALDQGLALLMIENARTGLLWNLFMRDTIAQRAVAAAGFRPGSLEEPVASAMTPGNPGALLAVPMIDHAVTVDADLSEWIRHEAIELSPTQRRHIEWGFIRGAADASVLAYVGWSKDAFYAAGIVTDDEIVARRHGAQLYQDDCIELFWDLDGDGFRFDGNPSDVQIGLAPGGPGEAGQLWAWGALNRVPDGVQAALKQEPGRFLFEIRVPLSMLPGLTGATPARFSLAYHDRDHDGKGAKLNWSVDTASHPGTTLFGRIHLEGSESAALQTGATP